MADVTEKTAAELKEDLKTATAEQATDILNAENQREEPRVTVVSAAQARLEELDQPGEVQDSTPTGAWAQLLDGDGKPVLVDGKPVATELVV